MGENAYNFVLELLPGTSGAVTGNFV